MSLPPELARLLHDEREDVVPFVGSGLVKNAGVPGVWGLAKALRERSAQENAVIPPADFNGVCAEVESKLGLAFLQRATAEIVGGVLPKPDGVLLALVRCPSRVLLTTNYDCSLERAIELTGRTPVTFGLERAQAWKTPADGEVHVVHLHGVCDQPETMVFPGSSTTALEDDERFKTLLRAVVAPKTVLYLGFAFGEAETHLRPEMDWLARSFSDSGAHHILLPKQEVAGRGSELDDLLAKPNVHGHFYDEAVDGHVPVLEAALLLAPQPPPYDDEVSAPLDEYFVMPVVAAASPDTPESELDAALMVRWMGPSEVPEEDPSSLVALGRVVLEGNPGMGKSQVLLAMGFAETSWMTLLLRLPDLVSYLDGARNPLRAALQFMNSARRFKAGTHRATRRNLQEGTYALLLDGFDEVPEARRSEVLAAVVALVDAHPQHSYVVATRPVADIAPLYDHGFARRVLRPTGVWGHRYMNLRSVPDGKLRRLSEQLPRTDELMQVPVYAAAIATALCSDDAEAPTTPLGLLLSFAAAGLRHDVDRLAAEPREMTDYLRDLAVVLQLRNRSEAAESELLEIRPAGDVTTAAATREEMVARALLRDRDGSYSFPLRVVQEALCAEAILQTPDPAETVRRVAAAQLDGAWELRGDMDHVLDLVWENASPEARVELRSLDELRFARTQDPNDDLAAEDALDIIWSWFERRQIWLTDEHDRRELRGPESAVRRLLRASPSAAERRQSDLVKATGADGSATRANALEWLAHLPRQDAETTLGWLAPRLQDDHPVVRRQACEAAVDLEVPEALDLVLRQIPLETDDAAMGELGWAASELATDLQAPHIAATLFRYPQAWQSAHALVDRLRLTSLLAVLGQEPGDEDDWDRLLTLALTRQFDPNWDPDSTELLVHDVVVRSQYVDMFKHLDRLEELASRCPAAAVAGVVRAAETVDVRPVDVLFLRALDADALRVDDEKLAEVFATLKSPGNKRKGSEAKHPPSTELVGNGHSYREPARPTDPDRVPLEEAISQEMYRADRPPQARTQWSLQGVSATSRETLRSLIEAWWPQDPVRDLLPMDASQPEGPVDGNALAVVLAAATMDFAVTPLRWLDVFSSSALPCGNPGVAEWLRRKYAERSVAEAIDVVSTLPNVRYLAAAARALDMRNEAAVQAVLARLSALPEPDVWSEVVSTVAAGGHLDLIRAAWKNERHPEKKHSLSVALAHWGDVDAQIDVIRRLTDNVRNGEHPDKDSLAWQPAAKDERLVEPLGELLKVLPADSDPFDGLRRRVHSTFASIASERALKVYDQIADDPTDPNRAFEWYPRNALARQIATTRVLERLPTRPAELLATLAEEGPGTRTAGSPGQGFA